MQPLPLHLIQPKKANLASQISLSHSRIKVQAGDKWLIVGTTGSGKTTFSKILVAQLLTLFPKSRLYVFDSKFAGDFDGWPGRVQTQREPPPRPSAHERIQIWQPIHLEPLCIEAWLQMILNDAPAIAYIDELVHLCYKARQTSEKYSEILKVGRALPVGVITCTQELAQIPRNAVGQATHIARFRLLVPYEQQVMRRVMNATKKIDEPVDDFGFFYSSTRVRGEPQYFPDAQAFFDRRKRE